MKKLKIIIPVSFLLIVIGVVTAYLAYGSTLVDVTSEKSIIENFSSVPEQPITILKTAQFDDYFAAFYEDPADEEDGYYHFRYITRASLYKNRYHNLGGYSKPSIGITSIDELNKSDEKRTTAEVLISGIGDSIDNTYEYSIFKFDDYEEYYFNYEDIKSTEEIIEKIEKQKSSYEKIDEFVRPDDTFIIEKTYALDNPREGICIAEGFDTTVDDLFEGFEEGIINDYYEYLKSVQNNK